MGLKLDRQSEPRVLASGDWTREPLSPDASQDPILGRILSMSSVSLCFFLSGRAVGCKFSRMPFSLSIQKLAKKFILPLKDPANGCVF